MNKATLKNARLVLEGKQNQVKGPCRTNLKYTVEIFKGFNTVCILIP